MHPLLVGAVEDLADALKGREVILTSVAVHYSVGFLIRHAGTGFRNLAVSCGLCNRRLNLSVRVNDGCLDFRFGSAISLHLADDFIVHLGANLVLRLGLQARITSPRRTGVEIGVNRFQTEPSLLHDLFNGLEVVPVELRHQFTGTAIELAGSLVETLDASAQLAKVLHHAQPLEAVDDLAGPPFDARLFGRRDGRWRWCRGLLWRRRRG